MNQITLTRAHLRAGDKLYYNSVGGQAQQYVDIRFSTSVVVYVDKYEWAPISGRWGNWVLAHRGVEWSRNGSALGYYAVESCVLALRGDQVLWSIEENKLYDERMGAYAVDDVLEGDVIYWKTNGELRKSVVGKKTWFKKRWVATWFKLGGEWQRPVNSKDKVDKFWYPLSYGVLKGVVRGGKVIFGKEDREEK